MSSALDMSLDDLIKNNKKSGGSNSRGRGRSTGPGPSRFHNRGASRTAPYSTPKPVQALDSIWTHEMFAGQVAAAYPAQAARAAAVETGTKLYISNLDYGVSNEDIKELFSEVGDLKRYSINYDKSGRSKGTAEVVFTRRADAMAAVERYNNVQLDGKPMKIEIVGANIITPAPVVIPAANGLYGNENFGARSSQGRNNFIQPRGGGGVHGGRVARRGRGLGRGHGEKVSAEELDADLDKYHLEAMQTK